ncbi:Uncharacterized protein TCM_012065 [Theobroma cacao]|nr:Uncharacterized protein TCM_012065 [Theobroma cacao]
MSSSKNSTIVNNAVIFLDATSAIKSISKIDFLREVDYIPEEGKTQPLQLSLTNPYSVYAKPTFSPVKSIKTLIKHSPKAPKEYIQSTRFDEHFIQGDQAEQFVTLQIPLEFPQQWIHHGYSHIHFGAVRLALNYHGREGQSVVAHMALLDSRYIKYEHACIGTVEDTLNTKTLIVTLFPNYTMALCDPNLLSALKVQVQIIRAPQIPFAIIATLHYQMVYKVQDHAFNLSKIQTNLNDALVLAINISQALICSFVPKRIPREDLAKLLPEKWIINYEKLQ